MERTGKRFRNHLMGLVLLAGVHLGSACSVKEDRDLCPGLLSLDFVCPDIPDARHVGLLVTSDEDVVWSDTVDVMMNGDGYSVSVPQTRLHVRAWTGDDAMVTESGLVIPYGQDCPRVYMHDSDIMVTGEYFHEVVTLRKNHCVMTLNTEGEGRIPSDLKLRGNVAGYDAEGAPLYGSFEFLLEDGGLEEGYKAVLPRQMDASLMLVIDDGGGSHKAFALGQYIVSSGYDWTAPDLEDITVTLDYALTEIRLIISGWESVYEYEMEI